MDKYWEVKTSIANPENLKIINEFLLSLNKANRRRSTIILYRVKLQIFFEEMEILFSALTLNDIQGWLNNNQKNWKEVTIQNFLYILKSFFSYCVKKLYIVDSPFRKEEVNYWELKTCLPNVENQKVINEYLLHLTQSNRNEKSITKTRDKLMYLFKEKKAPFSSQTPENTKRWVEENQERMKARTISNYLYSLRSFYHFCVEKNYVSENPIYYQREKEVRYWEVKILLPNKGNKERINEFLLNLHVANYSKSTINSYRYILQYFFKEKIESYSTISSKEIQQWLIQLQSNRTVGTITYHINVLHSFYKFCVEEGYMDKSPMKRRWIPRLPQPVPKYLTKEETAKVRKQSEKENLHNQALVEFLLTSGCRVGEVFTLNRSDLDLEKRTTLVIGKGQKIRGVHFSVRCGILLERYLESRNDQNPALFITNHINPRRLSINWMRAIIKRMGKKQG